VYFSKKGQEGGYEKEKKTGTEGKKQSLTGSPRSGKKKETRKRTASRDSPNKGKKQLGGQGEEDGSWPRGKNKWVTGVKNQKETQIKRRGGRNEKLHPKGFFMGVRVPK